MKVVRADEPRKMLDTLLCCAMIEARSCERMRLLSEHLEDEGLALELSEKGRKRTQELSWDRTAAETLAVWREAEND